MIVNLYRMSSLAMAASLALPTAALAQTAPADSKPEQTVELSADTQEFSDGYGSLRSVRLEYRLDFGDTTVVFSPAVGRRDVGGVKSTAGQIGGAIYHDFSDSFSTRTAAFIAEDEPVFARYDLAQDFTVRIADKTTATVGVRWAQYFGNRDVYFVSGGLRRYFKGGSVAYRLTYTKPDGRDGFLAQMANLTLNDARGSGKTQLWLNTGAASLDRTPLDGSFSGDDYGGLVQRTQPISQDFSLALSAGLQSYARPAGRVTGTKLGLGLLFSVE